MIKKFMYMVCQVAQYMVSAQLDNNYYHYLNRTGILKGLKFFFIEFLNYKIFFGNKSKDHFEMLAVLIFDVFPLNEF